MADDTTRLPQGWEAQGSLLVARPLNTLIRDTSTGELFVSTDATVPAYTKLSNAVLVITRVLAGTYAITTANLDKTILACDTTAGGAFTVTLEAAPAQSRDLAFKNTGLAALTIARNGKTIDNRAEDFTVVAGAAFRFVYDATDEWMVF